MTLKQQTVSGVIWTGMAKMILQGFVMLVMIILARLLSVDEFGVLGMAPLLTVAMSLINDRGFGIAIIQRKNLQNEQLSSVFWGGVVFGIVLLVVTLIIARPLAVFLNEPRLEPVTAVLGIGFVIGAFAVVQRSLLMRDMKFKLLALVEIVTIVISGMIAVIMAFMRFGIWSLVANILVKYAAEAIILWFISHWHPRFHFRFSEFKGFFRFSSNVMAMDFVTYINQNADITIIEKVLGSKLLGYYSFAMNLVKMPINRLSSVVSRVVFPAFAVVQDDITKFKNSYLKSMKLISVFTFPILAVLAILSKEIIIVFLTEKWLPLQIPLIILTPMAMLKSIGTIRGPVLMARGKPQILVVWNLIYFFPLVAVIYWGTHYELLGVSLGFTVLYIITFPIIQYLTDREVGITAKEFYTCFLTTFAATLFMTLTTFGFKLLCKNVFNFNDLAVLLVCLILCLTSYLTMLWLLDRDIVLEVVDLILKKSSKSRSGKYAKITGLETEQ